MPCQPLPHLIYAPMNSRKLSTKHIIIIVLLVIHLSPIWIFKYFPSLDGPGHVYNAYVLKEYHKHENYKLREVYELNLTIFPNWSSPIILALLMYPTLRTYFGGLQDLLKSCKPAWVLSLLIFDNPIRAWIRFELRPKTVFFGRLNGRKASIHGVRNTEYMNC